jgi:hypothetical protein
MRQNVFTVCRPKFERKNGLNMQTVIKPAKTVDYFYAFSGVADPDLIIFEK